MQQRNTLGQQFNVLDALLVNVFQHFHFDLLCAFLGQVLERLLNSLVVEFLYFLQLFNCNLFLILRIKQVLYHFCIFDISII